ncbi:hypothetical protein [Actinomyces ruminis]|uniref:O-Antigen ligase n=1 Tax=Actinomyces ruminis TaxID=1937003 RepID=A0ABX4MDQ4_9ACTO|nr:hypothetical protein [Actinomyces ruminis]PHP53638.1 hypothetical protein BW737_001290 [Actinomyces ruminis]
MLAAAVVAAVSWRTSLAFGINPGDVVAIALLPLTWRASRHSRVIGLLMLCSLTAIAAGLVLSLAAAGEFTIVPSSAMSVLLAAAAIPSGAAVIIWATQHLGLDLAAACFTTGLLIDASIRALSLDNPWKFAYGLPTSVLLLALAHRRSRTAEVLAAVVLAGIYLLNDARSAIGFLLVTAAIVICQAIASGAGIRPAPRTAFRAQTSLLVALGLLAVGVVMAASSSGYLGDAAQARTAAQSASSNILTAARPEMGATLALFQHRPWGYGAGVAPRYSDTRVAMDGMQALGHTPDNNYVLHYMLGGGQFELHSGLGDLWAALSLPGLTLGLLVIALSFAALGRTLATVRSRGWVVFTVIVVVWNCLFGPLSTIVPYMELAIAAAVCLPSVAEQTAQYRTSTQVR